MSLGGYLTQTTRQEGQVLENQRSEKSDTDSEFRPKKEVRNETRT